MDSVVHQCVAAMLPMLSRREIYDIANRVCGGERMCRPYSIRIVPRCSADAKTGYECVGAHWTRNHAYCRAGQCRMELKDPGGCNEIVLLHELAHHVANGDTRDHGALWAEEFRRLIAEYGTAELLVCVQETEKWWRLRA